MKDFLPATLSLHSLPPSIHRLNTEVPRYKYKVRASGAEPAAARSVNQRIPKELRDFHTNNNNETVRQRVEVHKGK